MNLFLDCELIVCAGLLLAGIGFSIHANQLSSGPHKARASLVSAMLIGAAFCVLGIFQLIGIHASRRTSATGVVRYVSVYHGRHSHSTFYVYDADGRWLFVHSDYTGDHLFDGESVRVEVLDYQATLLNLTVLDGQFAGWALNEGDGTITACFVLALGGFLIYGARNKRKRDPEASEEYQDYRVPKTGVDEKSLLNLSKRGE